MNSQPSTLTPEPKLALVGAGYWGRNLARNFHALQALHALCDRDQRTLETYGPEYESVRKTTQFTEVLNDAGITRIAIAVPAVLHYSLAKAALEAGKDVFVEKPICLKVDEARSLVRLAAERERVLMVGHLLQHHPLVQELHLLVARGELGRLQYITSNRLNLGKIRREENALWSFAPHDISVILSLVGNRLPENVRCTGGEYLNHGIADTTLTALRFEDGVRAHVYVSWLNPFKEQKLTVVGSEGLAVFDDTRPWNEKLLLYRHPITWTNGQVPTPSKVKGEPVLLPEAEPLRSECQHFLACCDTRRTPRTDGAEGLRVLQVLQAAQESLDREGEAIPPEARSSEAKAQDATLCRSSTPKSGPAPDYYVHPTAVLDEGAQIGKGTKVWHFSHVMKGAKLGERCVLGQNVNVDGGVVIGNNVKVQNNVSIYTGLVIEDDVFLGPSCVLTNVSNPRSQINRHSLYERTVIRRGATIGANATIVCGVAIGRYAFIGAGAVVTGDVPDYALMLGNPARRKGWMSRHGHVLNHTGDDTILICPESGFRYRLLANGSLHCLDFPEEEPLPTEQSVGNRTYREFKTVPKRSMESAPLAALA